MNDPCRYCVKPERHHGCHDHCEKRMAYRESDEYKKLCEYKDTYFKNHLCKNSSILGNGIRRAARKGRSLYGYRVFMK